MSSCLNIIVNSVKDTDMSLDLNGFPELFVNWNCLRMGKRSDECVLVVNQIFPNYLYYKYTSNSAFLLEHGILQGIFCTKVKGKKFNSGQISVQSQ